MSNARLGASQCRTAQASVLELRACGPRLALRPDLGRLHSPPDAEWPFAVTASQRPATCNCN